MIFGDFRKKLAHGELKNTSAVSDSEAGTIDPQYLETIRSLTNSGLKDISTRKPIITRLVDLTFVEDQNLYPLSDGAAYLDDTGLDVFVADELIQVREIQDSEGRIYVPDSDGHIMTPSFNTLRFTTDRMEDLGEKVRIRYQALHPQIPEDEVSAAAFQLLLPPSLHTALRLYVASLYISHMNGQEHTIKGDAYFGAYLREMGEDDLQNTSSTSETHEDTRFEDRGFV